MVRQHHQFNGHHFEQTLEDNEGQGSPACCSLWGSVQFSSVAQSCLTLCDPVDCSTPGLPVLHHLPEFTQTHVCRVGDTIQLSHPQSPSSPFAFSLPQRQSLFQSVGSWHEGPKYWSFSFSISSSNVYSGLISFRNDWFDHLAVQGTLKSLLQHHNLRA